MLLEVIAALALAIWIYLLAGRGGMSGDFHGTIENSHDQGLEVIRADGKVYARRRYGKFRERSRDRGPDPLGEGPGVEVVEHHRHREDRRDRVGDPLAGDVGGRAVNRLEHAGCGSKRIEVP